ncbi:MAG: hypothetical protein HFH75_00005 [Lachnospiraceae bacterium]|jgi:hypothetical protein|nr:hypothetical protein [Lachnospiraceae bacterium]
MRKAQKQQAEELVKQMEEAHDQFKKFIEQGSIPPAMELLEECQNGGITLGTLIENTEGEGHPTVLLLEEYCELIYQVHENLTEAKEINKEINLNKIYKNLRQKLIRAANSLKNDVPVRKEVVFLPYKASMWDSLESVWKAADEDENCDAYVIPIPYYDKNPDGSFREMHYEADQYPGYVPITRYDTYDFEQRRPDMIYIHNAYDHWNLVTSIHPDFFSVNLKKYTEKLIYIPYFVLDEVDPDNEQAVENVKHFCFMPGIINADKVIVQSEDMKKIYIKEYLRAAKEHRLQGKHLDRTYLEQKFLGLGSPKYDRVCATNRQDLDIPLRWLKVIEKADGSWKKIIFYNTGIAALLTHNEKWVDKIENVLRTFRENQDEVALLWRPHPLIESTMKSMRPEVLRKFMAIKEDYITQGWGIYDETADVDRAVVLSDAYYGDGSSVVQLYRQTGKPVMIQNVEVVT